jgi:hypothetical protein
LNAVAHGGGRWLAVGERGTVLVSDDATSWSARPALGSGFLRALAFGQGQFLIGGANGTLHATPDGTRDPTYIATTVTANVGVIGGANELAVTVVAESGLYAASSNWNRGGASYSFIKFRPDGGRDPTYTAPPSSFSRTTFAYRRDGGLWQIQRPFPLVAGTGFIATAYGPTGERDRTRHARRFPTKVTSISWR